MSVILYIWWYVFDGPFDMSLVLVVCLCFLLFFLNLLLLLLRIFI